MKVHIATTIMLLVLAGSVSAQMTPQQQVQAPPSDPSSSQYNSVYPPAHGVGDTIQKGAREKWADRWGAIAMDDSGHAGIVSEMPSEWEAQRAALAECTYRGVAGCDVAYAYYNQCTAISPGNGTKWANAPSVKEAVETSMQQCQKDGGSCRVYYSGCSLPERIQY